MKRRTFITLLGGAAAWPLAARAQQPMPVIGYFSARSPVTDVRMLSVFRQGLSETGYVEGRNVAIELRWAEGRYDRLLELAHDLVRRNVAVIVTTGGESTARAAKTATSSIPIVFISGSDPVESGLVASLSRPGGNLTGVSSILSPLMPKQVGLLSELAPTAILIGALVSPEALGATATSRIAELEDAGRAVGQYWASFAEYLKEKGSTFRIRRPNKDHWFWFAIGRAGFGISATISTDKERIGVELYASHDVDKAAFNALHAQKAAIEAEFGEPLLWQELPGKKASRIVLYKTGVDPSNEAQYPELHAWMLSKMERFRSVFGSRVKALSLAPVTATDEDDGEETED
jgi:Domain of unknown function (DUF4268)/ABC transporter substrate binding protein